MLLEEGARHELLQLGGYASYVQGVLKPSLWYRLNELSGVTARNSGTLGTAYNGVYTACILAQPGKMSATGAILMDGATSLVTIPGDATDRAPTGTAAFLLKPSSSGEGNAGKFHNWGGLCFTGFVTAGLRLDGREQAATTPATSQGAAGSPLVTTAWQWLFRIYDDVGERKVRFYIGINGALAEIAYSSGPTAAIGLANAKTGLNLILGNKADASATYAGLYDEMMYDFKLWTTAQMLQLVKLTNV